MTDVVTDIITVMTWHQWCQEGTLDCHWWIVGVVFVLLPVCASLVATAVNIYQLRWKYLRAWSLQDLIFPILYPIWHIVGSIYANYTNHKNKLLSDMLNNLRFANFICECIPQAIIQWFLIFTHGELYKGTGTILGRKYDIFWVSITSAIISSIRCGL